MQSSSSEKKLVKSLKATIFGPKLHKEGVTMGHAQNKETIFFTEIKPGHKLSKLFILSKYHMF